MLNLHLSFLGKEELDIIKLFKNTIIPELRRL